MERETLQKFYQEQVYQDEAGLRAFETLLNCYCREVAGPEGHVTTGALFGRRDWPLALRVARHQGTEMLIVMPRMDCRLLVLVDQASLTGNYRYSPVAYYKQLGQSWARLSWQTLATLIVKDLAIKYGQLFNDELLDQIHESVAVTRRFLDGNISIAPHDPLAAFLYSEQSLRFGHPFHPAPKSRQGFSRAQVDAYSPEKGAAFPLHYFSVRREFLLQRSELLSSCDELVAAQGPIELEKEFSLLPVHPWQAGFLLQQPLLQQALARGAARDHGVAGQAYYPTSSVRTLYHPDNPYFYKCSLHVRLTNCVRKNAIYELDGALAVTRIMRRLLPELNARFPGLRVMEEPAYQSIDLQSDDKIQNRLLTEGFGMILRQSIASVLDEHVTPIMAGALFGNQEIGRRWVARLMHQLSATLSLPAAEAVEVWFSAYVQHLIGPVFYCFFEHGVIFEPHLQNVVIGMRHGMPVRLFLRDFEGVKLVDGRAVATLLAGESDELRDALCFSDENGWKRIAYCLFVNNLCEAISQLAGGDAALERRFWSLLGEQLAAYQQVHGTERSQPYIRALLQGEAFPAKANLINRFFKRPDREVTYLPLHNPIVKPASDA